MDDKKTRPGEATPGQATAGQTACGGASFPILNYSTAPRGCQVVSLLGVGAKNGIKLNELVQMTGKNERIIRRMIQCERKNGVLILADNEHGYFLPANTGEIQRYCRSMKHRCSEIAAVTRMAERALADAEGQTVIEGW